MPGVSDRQAADPARAATTRRAQSLPGIWQAGAAALLSGLACWYSLLPQLRDSSAADTSALAEVADADIPAALDSMAGSEAFLAQFKQQARTCARRLAWLSVVRQGNAPAAAPERIRLRSGNYYTPALTLLDTPIRVAIPYPAPYETGRGALTVLGGSGSVIALTPPWRIAPPPASAPAGPSDATRTVTWPPAADCRPARG